MPLRRIGEEEEERLNYVINFVVTFLSNYYANYYPVSQAAQYVAY